MKIQIECGNKFGKWTVLSNEKPDGHYRSRHLCKCSCGTEKIVLGQNLKNGISKSCGHDRAAIHTTHGERKNRTPEYCAWTAMKQRCLNKKCRLFKDWGGRGIKICRQWVNSYEAFLKDVGRRPSAAHSLGRKSNSGNYDPSNVRWEVQLEQNNNKRSNRFLIFNGENLTVAQWARKIGVHRNTVLRKLARGKTIAECLTT